MGSEPEITLSVSDFVALVNQTLEFAYPNVTVTGEMANFRVSKNRWVYFDLKDELSSVRCFGTVYQLPGPLEDGLLLNVRATPRLHSQYGFSLNIMSVQPAGEGSIKKAASLLEAKLAAEGLFDEQRKRSLPYPPARIGLITSSESAAYADFVKILAARWGGVAIELIDVQVQGEAAPAQIVAAIEAHNGQAEPPEVLVIIRGGGSAEDLQAFSTEQVVRAVAGSRVPTLVAIGHEIDVSLAELAADVRASTPSNAAELLVPDKLQLVGNLRATEEELYRAITARLHSAHQSTVLCLSELNRHMERRRGEARTRLDSVVRLLEVLNPQAVLRRGYAIVRHSGAVVRRGQTLKAHDTIQITFADTTRRATVEER